jgi:hypothetical protein
VNLLGCKVLGFRELRRFVAEHMKPLIIAGVLFAVGFGLHMGYESMGYGGFTAWGLDLLSSLMYVAVLAIVLSFYIGRRVVILCAGLGFATVLCNGIVMGVNGGYMPTVAGGVDLPYREYILATDMTHLNWLGDWMRTSMFGCLVIFSPGDAISFVIPVVVSAESARKGFLRFCEFLERRRKSEVPKVT